MYQSSPVMLMVEIRMRSGRVQPVSPSGMPPKVTSTMLRPNKPPRLLSRATVRKRVGNLRLRRMPGSRRDTWDLA